MTGEFKYSNIDVSILVTSQIFGSVLDMRCVRDHGEELCQLMVVGMFGVRKTKICTNMALTDGKSGL